jgi:hypothetical protein
MEESTSEKPPPAPPAVIAEDDRPGVVETGKKNSSSNVAVTSSHTRADSAVLETKVHLEMPSPRKDSKKKKASNIFIPAAKPDDLDCPSERIRLGICAMDKKARSKPMGEILSRLDEKLFRVVFFGDQMIQNEPVEDWPICDVLIAFYSTGGGR